MKMIFYEETGSICHDLSVTRSNRSGQSVLKAKRDASHATVQEQILFIRPPCSSDIERAVCGTNITDGNKNNVHQGPNTKSSKTEKLSNPLLPVAQVESETGFGSQTIG